MILVYNINSRKGANDLQFLQFDYSSKGCQGYCIASTLRCFQQGHLEIVWLEEKSAIFCIYFQFFVRSLPKKKKGLVYY